MTFVLLTFYKEPELFNILKKKRNLEFLVSTPSFLLHTLSLDHLLPFGNLRHLCTFSSSQVTSPLFYHEGISRVPLCLLSQLLLLLTWPHPTASKMVSPNLPTFHSVSRSVYSVKNSFTGPPLSTWPFSVPDGSVCFTSYNTHKSSSAW